MSAGLIVFLSSLILGCLLGMAGVFLYYRHQSRQMVKGKGFGFLNEPKVQIDRNILQSNQKDYSVDDFRQKISL